MLILLMVLIHTPEGIAALSLCAQANQLSCWKGYAAGRGMLVSKSFHQRGWQHVQVVSCNRPTMEAVGQTCSQILLKAS